MSKPKLWPAPSITNGVGFHCPGCALAKEALEPFGDSHRVPISPQGWTQSGPPEAPTLNPSLLTTLDLAAEQNAPARPFTRRVMVGGRHIDRFTCHLFVRDGQIQFLSDSTHPLAGQTVPMEDVEL